MSRTAIIIGGGHNGLTAAYYLARGMREGRVLTDKLFSKVTVFERRGVVGGAAVTEEFVPGFRNSTASYSVGLLSPEVVKEMGLTTDHGLKLTPRRGAHFLPLSDSSYFHTTYDQAENSERLARWSAKDAAAYQRFCGMMESVVPFLQDLFVQVPPSVPLEQRWRFAGSLFPLLHLLRQRFQDTVQLKDAFELFTRSCGEFLDDLFETEPLKALLAFDAITGHYDSIYSPGTAYVMLHHVMGQIFEPPGRWGHAEGGMGAITQAMASACRATGKVDLVTNAPVKCVLTADDGKTAIGVELADGSRHFADLIVSNVHPRTLFLDLAAPHVQNADADFAARVRRYRSGSGTLRINVALNELPRFTCLPDDPLVHHSSILFAPSLQYIENAYLDARTLGYARQPVIEMMTPSAYDDTLAPPGKHVASLFCQHMDPSCDRVDEALEAVISTVDKLAPNFRSSIIGKPLVLSPKGLEERFGLVNGDIFHGHLSLAQIWAARPVVGWGSYSTPLKNLYLCGSGSHPGGGVTGYPGRNASTRIVEDYLSR